VCSYVKDSLEQLLEFSSVRCYLRVEQLLHLFYDLLVVLLFMRIIIARVRAEIIELSLSIVELLS
jgi:hypothetical protein